MPQIIATFGPDGSVKIEAQGYDGSSCKEATKFLEDALGKVTDDKKTPEFYRRAKQSKQLKAGQ